MANDYVVISVQSQKGGVGKTTVALNLARMLQKSNKYEVLLIDLDVAGTNAHEAIKSKLWKEIAFPVEFHSPINIEGKNSIRKITNIVEMFDYYMAGEDVPRPFWKDKKIKVEESSGTVLSPGDVNVIGSALYVLGKTTDPCGPSKTTYGPSVLFDEAHSAWFIDMIRTLVESIAMPKARENKRLAVVLDTSPGFSGLGPNVEDWLTDIGPKRAKFLVVNSLDYQDVVACIHSISRLRSKFQAKWKAAKAFKSLLKNAAKRIELDDGDEPRFFARLASSHHDNDNGNDTQSAHVQVKTVGQESCDSSSLTCGVSCCDQLAFYRKAIGGETYLKDLDKWMGVVYNRVPWQVMGGFYQYNWPKVGKDLISNDKKLSLSMGFCKDMFIKYKIPYSDDFSFQFIVEQMKRAAPFKGVLLINNERPVFSENLSDALERLSSELQHGSTHDNVERLVNTIGKAEKVFREEIARDNTRKGDLYSEYRINWIRFAPSWRFTNFMRAYEGVAPSKRRLDPNMLSGHFQAAQYVVHDQLQLEIASLSDWMDEQFRKDDVSQHGRSIVKYVAVSCIASIALRRSLAGKVDTPKTLTREMNLTKRLMIQALWVDKLQYEGLSVGANPYCEKFWSALVADQVLLRRVENSFYKSDAFEKYDGEQVGRHSDEFANFCRSQLALWSSDDDLRLIRSAIRLLKKRQEKDSTELLLSVILSETITWRRMSYEIASKLVTNYIGGGDSLAVLTQLNLDELFCSQLEGMLCGEKWGLL